MINWSRNPNRYSPNSTLNSVRPEDSGGISGEDLNENPIKVKCKEKTCITLLNSDNLKKSEYCSVHQTKRRFKEMRLEK